MDELALLADRISASHHVSITVRPGVAFAYFGNGAGIEIRLTDDDRFDCTLLCPEVPVLTLRASAIEVLELAAEVAGGRFTGGSARGAVPSR